MITKLRIKIEDGETDSGVTYPIAGDKVIVGIELEDYEPGLMYIFTGPRPGTAYADASWFCLDDNSDYYTIAAGYDTYTVTPLDPNDFLSLSNIGLEVSAAPVGDKYVVFILRDL